MAKQKRSKYKPVKGEVGRVVELLGGTSVVAKLCRVTPSTVSGWKRNQMVPPEHAVDVAHAGGSGPELLCPAAFRPPSKQAERARKAIAHNNT